MGRSYVAVGGREGNGGEGGEGRIQDRDDPSN